MLASAQQEMPHTPALLPPEPAAAWRKGTATGCGSAGKGCRCSDDLAGAVQGLLG